MEDRKKQPETTDPLRGNSNINLIVSKPDNQGDSTIDLALIFNFMSRKRRLFAWVMVLCVLVGICAPMLMYQFSKDTLTVTAAVTLRYDVEDQPVSGLIAPDGSPLDLTKITSSYVLQNALQGLTLARTPSLTDLSRNLKIERLLSDDSRRQQEVASRMVSDKSSGAYGQVQAIKLTYSGTFLVSLTNRFSAGNTKYQLPDEEVRLILMSILDSYNDYLAVTYGDHRLPDDDISLIDVEHLDVMECLEQVQTCIEALQEYCESQSDAVRAYRSWQTGWTLQDLEARLDLVSQICVDYLYSYVNINNIVADRDTVKTGYEYRLRNTQSSLESVEGKIQSVAEILDTYKNDQISVSMQESGEMQTTQTTTDYYNRLVLEQIDNYEKEAGYQVTISNLNYRIQGLEAEIEEEALQEVRQEFDTVYAAAKAIVAQIRAHMEEVHASPFYLTYLEHTAAVGKTIGMVQAIGKKVAVGAVAGAVIGAALWFMSAVLQAVRSGRKENPAEGGRAQ